jgi:hypothetical protein
LQVFSPQDGLIAWETLAKEYHSLHCIQAKVSFSLQEQEFMNQENKKQ